MRKHNGVLTLREIYMYVESDENNPFNQKSYKSNIRCFLQRETEIYLRIKPGLYGLQEYKDKFTKEILDSIQESNLSYFDRKTEHAQFQANLIYIGKKLGFETYIFSQDKTRKIDDNKRLKDIVDTITMPQFTYKDVINKIKTIDVIWFDGIKVNEEYYKYPKVVFEVEHSTDIKKSLDKFILLKPFNIQYMYIVAPKTREDTFNKIIKSKDYESIRDKIMFLKYEDVEYFLENPNSLIKFDLI